MTVFDAHAHCFPPLGDDGGIKRMRLAEHQYHVRFHKQGIRRFRDGARIDATLLAGKTDGVSYQPDVLRQMDRRPHLVALDTMDYWIERSGQELVDAVKQSDVVFMDEREAKSFARASNAVNAARAIQSLGPRTVVVKRGEYGALLFHDGAAFAAPALPLDRVVDPTGAGDAFAGGFMGYLSATGDLREGGFRRATAAGAVMGAFAVEEFSIERLAAVTAQEIDDRFRELAALTWLPPLADDERLPARAGRDEGRNK